MITSGIVDATTPHAETVLRAMKSAKITRYRWGGLKYNDRQPIAEQLQGLKRQAAAIAELNAKYNVCAMYHTHSGLEVGASIWDLWEILKDLDNRFVAVNLDLGHCTIEGGVGGYVTNTRLIAPLTRGIAVKDFKWTRNPQGEWRPAWCPLGEGMVNFARLFTILKASSFNGPIQLHFEYPLGGAEGGKKSLSVAPDVVIGAMKRDLSTLRGWLLEGEAR
jgi:sugar phosphate isomerase/epimerase